MMIAFGIALMAAIIPPMYVFIPAIEVDASLDYSVDNFPEDATVTDKVIASVIYELGEISIDYRPNQLNEEDFAAAKKNLQKGDVVLVGDFKSLSSVAIGGPVTHTMLYVDNERFIHAHAEGVEIISLDEVFDTYDTMIVVRLRDANPTVINAAIEYAYDQLGKPYDFNFEYGAEAFYCSELVDYVYQSAGVDPIEVVLNKASTTAIASIMDVQALHPIDFVGGDFRTVFMSHNVEG